MARVLYFDCFSGASGDMLLGAFLDAGLPRDALERALGSLGAGHELRIERVLRAGLSATRVEVREAAPGAGAGAEARGTGRVHDHPHHGPHTHDAAGHTHHEHRSLAAILHLIDHAALSEPARTRAKALFTRLAEVEAAIHQMPVDRIHLHEVGALDSIIDIVGVVFAFEWFGVEDVQVSPLNVGSGMVRMAHGTFPVPAPATLRLLEGVAIYSDGPAEELVTPTGALLLTGHATAWGRLPALRVERVGYGAGARDFPETPNVLRLVVGERVEGRQAGGAGEVVELVCEIDDMNPQLFGPLSERLFGAGALDVSLTPVVMKKGRPGTQVTVLADPGRREALATLLFRETTTLGLRSRVVARETLDRRWEDVALDGGTVRIKIAERRGEVVNAAPEFDDCVRVAAATGRPVKEVQAEAIAAWRARDTR